MIKWERSEYEDEFQKWNKKFEKEVVNEIEKIKSDMKKTLTKSNLYFENTDGVIKMMSDFFNNNFDNNPVKSYWVFHREEWLDWIYQLKHTAAVGILSKKGDDETLNPKDRDFYMTADEEIVNIFESFLRGFDKATKTMWKKIPTVTGFKFR